MSKHGLKSKVTASGRHWSECLCGLVIETYGIQHVAMACPIEDAEQDYAATVAVAVNRRDSAIAQWTAISEFHRRDLRASERESIAALVEKGGCPI